MENYKIKIVEDGPWDLYKIYVHRRLPNGDVEVQYNDIGKTFPRGSAIPIEPSFKLSREMLEEFADELSNMKFKPKEASYTQGKLESTEKHLEDMRNIVFKSNPIKLKK